ncbi:MULTISPECIES: hypothetical protein [unclassified Geodermatophilus]
MCLVLAGARLLRPRTGRVAAGTLVALSSVVLLAATLLAVRSS